MKYSVDMDETFWVVDVFENRVLSKGHKSRQDALNWIKEKLEDPYGYSQHDCFDNIKIEYTDNLLITSEGVDIDVEFE